LVKENILHDHKTESLIVYGIGVCCNGWFGTSNETNNNGLNKETKWSYFHEQIEKSNSNFIGSLVFSIVDNKCSKCCWFWLKWNYAQKAKVDSVAVNAAGDKVYENGIQKIGSSGTDNPLDYLLNILKNVYERLVGSSGSSDDTSQGTIIATAIKPRYSVGTIMATP
jgi:hypothetical protein